MVANNVNREPGTDYLNYGSCYYLLAELVSKFRTNSAGEAKSRLKYTKRLTEIMDYIEAHYRENLSLSDLAASQHLSVPYLSGFFSRHMGIKFSQYYIDVKLNHALQDLTGTDHTVERVAEDNGFPEVHTFIRTFKAKFGVTPNVYRKRNLAQQLIPGEDRGVNYLSTEPSHYLHYYSDIIPREAVDINLSNELITQLPKEPDDFSIFITSIRTLFEKLGVGELLAQGDGYFVTRRNGRIQIITYHYVHYGDIFAAGDAIGVTETSQYAPFDMSRRAAYSIPLAGLKDGRYVVKEYFVNREHGSAFDLWVKMGAMPLSPVDSEVYSHTCVPGFHAEYLTCENGLLTYSSALEPLEICFAELSPENG